MLLSFMSPALRFVAVVAMAFTIGAVHPAAAEEAGSYNLEGFRSAKFGMTEQQVRDAIKADFPAAKPTQDTNPVEKTGLLTITANDLLAGSGEARISYIFGYSTKKLIQVSVLWPGENKAQTTEVLVNTASILRDYFAGVGLPTEGMVLNAQATDGALVFFRGQDSKGRMAMLVLLGGPPPAKPGEPAPSTANLRHALQLSYVSTQKNPDIFKLPKGQF